MPIYNQRNYQDTLGTGPGTIAMWGCYLTSYAQVLSDFGIVIDPPNLNKLLPYIDGNLLSDHALDNLFDGKVTTTGVWDFRNGPANLDMIDDADPSTRFIIEVDFDHFPNNGIQTHFVTEASWDGTNLVINDPWYGTVDNFATNYGTDLGLTIQKVIRLQGPVQEVQTPVSQTQPPAEPSIPDPTLSSSGPSPEVSSPAPDPVPPVPGSVVHPEPAPVAQPEPTPAPETPAEPAPSQPDTEPQTQGPAASPVPSADVPAIPSSSSPAPVLSPQPTTTPAPGLDLGRFLSRKFLLTVAGLILSVLAYTSGAVDAGQALTSTTFLLGLYNIIQGFIDHANAEA